MKACDRILLVEDDPDLRGALRDILEGIGHAVECAADGDEAIASVRRAGPPAVALVDLHMPGRDGWSLALALAGDDPGRPRIPLILMSDPWNLHLARTRAMPGIAGCLPKPIDYRKLAALVARFAPALPAPAFAAAAPGA